MRPPALLSRSVTGVIIGKSESGRGPGGESVNAQLAFCKREALIMSTDSTVSRAGASGSRESTAQAEIESEHVGEGSQAGASTEQTPVPFPFAHQSEAEFAKILDFYGVRWEYEPRSFRLRWEGYRVVEMPQILPHRPGHVCGADHP